MHLLQIALVEINHGSVGGRLATGEILAGRYGFKSRFDQVHQMIVFQVAGRGNDNTIGLIQLVKKILYHAGIELENVFRGTQYGPSQGMFAPEILAGK